MTVMIAKHWIKRDIFKRVVSTDQIHSLFEMFVIFTCKTIIVYIISYGYKELEVL